MKTYIDFMQTHNHKSKNNYNTWSSLLAVIHLSPSVKSNLSWLQPSQWDACICVYFSTHISILGHVRLIPQTSCSREQHHLAAFISKLSSNVIKTQVKQNVKSSSPSVWDQWDFPSAPVFFSLLVITERLLIWGNWSKGWLLGNFDTHTEVFNYNSHHIRILGWK